MNDVPADATSERTPSQLLDERRLYVGTLLVLLVASGLAVAVTPGPTGHAAVANDSGDFETTADGVRYTIHPSELEQGCPGGKDCIPSIDDPRFQSADGAAWLSPNDTVIGVEVDGESKAYPLRILNVHEIVNDELAGRPIAVTYCPLCRSGLVFSRSVAGTRLTFGVSGKLIDANLVMYDRQTETYWSQLEGQAVVGTLVPTELEPLPSSITTWREWRRAHPETRVLSRDTGIYPAYTYDSNPYAGYENSNRVGPGVDRVDDRLPQKEIIYGVTVGETSRAYPQSVVDERDSINDEVAGVPILVVEDQRDGGIDVFARRQGNETLAFSVSNGTLVDDRGNQWSFDGEALEGPHEGARLERLSSHGFYWFAWSSFHPDTEVYEPS